MTTEITNPTDTRKGFFKLLEQVAQNHQVYMVKRCDSENVALISESDLTSLIETVYLLRSPANGNHLLNAIAESQSGTIKPQTVAELKQELGFDGEEEAAEEE